MQSLAINMGVNGYKKEQLNNYIPAILFTLYDGYYIYSSTKVDEEYVYMLKPYNYYAVRYYKDANNDVIINYSLDNYIVIYGWVNGDYLVKSGYLISETQEVNKENNISKYVPIQSGSSRILSMRNVTNHEYNPEYVNIELARNADFKDQRTEYLYPRNDNFYIDPDSAQKYYDEASVFSNWVSRNLGWITPAHAYRNGKPLFETYDEFNNNVLHIFQFNNSSDVNNNNPESSTSIFAQHKTDVIRTSIQDNLNQAITDFSNGYSTSYDYRLPILDINEWDIISNNICMLSFMQGVPMGTKYYNNYSLVKSTTNKLYVDPDSLYFTGADGCYHKIDCPNLSGNIMGHSVFEYELKRVKMGEEEYRYYYKISANPNTYEPCYACYYCIIDNKYTPIDWKSDPVKSRAYYTALAREKYSRYKSTSFLNTTE